MQFGKMSSERCPIPSSSRIPIFNRILFISFWDFAKCRSQEEEGGGTQRCQDGFAFSIWKGHFSLESTIFTPSQSNFSVYKCIHVYFRPLPKLDSFWIMKSQGRNIFVIFKIFCENHKSVSTTQYNCLISKATKVLTLCVYPFKIYEMKNAFQNL